MPKRDALNDAEKAFFSALTNEVSVDNAFDDQILEDDFFKDLANVEEEAQQLNSQFGFSIDEAAIEQSFNKELGNLQGDWLPISMAMSVGLA